MHTKLLLLSAVVFALVYCGVGAKCFAQGADVSALFEQAEQFVEDENYEGAEAIYKQVVTENPRTDDALEAQKLLTISYINRGKRDEAELALQELLAKFSENEHIAKAVDDIADEYRESKDYDKARQLYQHVVSNWSDADYALESQRGLILLNILVGDETAAQADIDKLLTEFSGHKDIAKVAAHVADDHRDLGKYESALELYRYVVETWPESEYAMGSEVSIARLNIKLGNETAAQAALGKLIADFRGNKGLAKAVDHVADSYRESKQYEKAKELYKYVVDTWPEAEHAIDSQTSLAKLYIQLGDDPNAQAAVERLATDFWQDTGLPAALCEIARRYERAKIYQEAKSVYQQIIEQEPNSPEADKAQLDIAKVDVLSLSEFGDDTAVPDALDYMIADFYEHPYLGEAIFRVGEKYYNEAFSCENRGLEGESKDYFRKTIAVWERIITELPESDITARAYHLTADCCRRLGQYEKAIGYYREIIANWPEYEYAGSAQFLIGYSYKKMKRAGAVSASIADAEIRTAYERVLEYYPDCGFVKAARDWLNYHSKVR